MREHDTAPFTRAGGDETAVRASDPNTLHTTNHRTFCPLLILETMDTAQKHYHGTTAQAGPQHRAHERHVTWSLEGSSPTRVAASATPLLSLETAALHEDSSDDESPSSGRSGRDSSSEGAKARDEILSEATSCKLAEEDSVPQHMAMSMT